jgi:PilZ domain
MRLYGRGEKRMSMVIAGYLLDTEGRWATEQVVTENVSPRGARFFTKCRWQSGERLRIAGFAKQFRVGARVLYCQPGPSGGFFIGLEFRERCADWWKDSVACKTVPSFGRGSDSPSSAP